MGIVKAGVCLHLTSKDQTKHLHVVLNDPKPYNDFPATVGVLSLSSTLKADTTVVLKPGDHPFVKRETFVVFAWAKVIDAAKLEVNIQRDGTIKHQDDCSAELLERIRQGVYASPFSKPAIKDYLTA